MLCPFALQVLMVVAAASAATQSTGRAALQPAAERKPAPDFSLRDAAGKTAKLKHYRGKVVLLDFWATWCTGCKKENSKTALGLRKEAVDSFESALRVM